MPYIGKQPTIGEFVELDALTASATDTYTLTRNSVAYYPETVNNLLVSINGVIQAGSTMSLSGNTLTVGATLSSSDVIDFVRVFGNVGNVVTPTDGSVTSAKLDTNIAISGNLDVGTIRSTNGTAAMTIDSSGRVLQPAKPSWRVQIASNQAFTTNSVEHPIAFDNTDSVRNNFLQGGCTLGGSPDYLVTVPVAGVYMVSLVIRVDGIDSGYVIARIEKNKNTATTTETTIISGNNTSTNYENLTATTVFQANAGDTFGATIMANADTNFSVVQGTELSGFLIG